MPRISDDMANKQPLIFLDIDDVLALNNGIGGFDVLEALGQFQTGKSEVTDFQHLWDALFDKQAVQHLLQLHDEFQPLYVISSSWTRFMNREAIAACLFHGGLPFVCQNLHTDWETEKIPRALRSEQIDSWLANHPDYKDRWIALDDMVSGTGYWDATNGSDCEFVVICQEGIGLQASEYALAQALLRRRSQ